MKIMIASDIHGSAHFCAKLLCAFRKEDPDRLLLLGDILAHGPRNNLPLGYDPKTVAAMLKVWESRICYIRGNCDAHVDETMLSLPFMADYCILTAGKRLIYATHGHLYNKDSRLPLSPGDILLHGHTHVPAWEPFGEDNLYCNPGAISFPRDDSPRGYMILEDNTFTWKTLDGTAYHTEVL